MKIRFELRDPMLRTAALAVIVRDGVVGYIHWLHTDGLYEFTVKGRNASPALIRHGELHEVKQQVKAMFRNSI